MFKKCTHGYESMQLIREEQSRKKTTRVYKCTACGKKHRFNANSDPVMAAACPYKIEVNL